MNEWDEKRENKKLLQCDWWSMDGSVYFCILMVHWLQPWASSVQLDSRCYLFILSFFYSFCCYYCCYTAYNVSVYFCCCCCFCRLFSKWTWMKVWHRAATVNYHMNNDNIHIRKLWCARSIFCLLIYFFRVLFERELVCVCICMSRGNGTCYS